MKEIILKVGEIPGIGLEAESISPDVFAGKDVGEIEELGVFVGNKKEKLGGFFRVEGGRVDDAGDLRIVVDGDVSRVKRIGQGMSAGEVLVKGGVGMHLGSGMSGGEIRVKGDAGSWVGMGMSGGEIVVGGDACNFIGSAYRGEHKGMCGGVIIIQGDVGSNIGGCMCGGMIKVEGNAGQFVGVRMQGGLIFVGGDVGSRVGAEMVKGTVVVGGLVDGMLPSFMVKGEVKKFMVDGREIRGDFTGYVGDLAEGGEGRVYVGAAASGL